MIAIQHCIGLRDVEASASTNKVVICIPAGDKPPALQKTISPNELSQPVQQQVLLDFGDWFDDFAVRRRQFKELPVGADASTARCWDQQNFLKNLQIGAYKDHILKNNWL